MTHPITFWCSDKPISRGVSQDWNLNIVYAADGTSSRNGSGDPSSGRKSISTNTILPVRPENESGTGSSSTTPHDLTSPWTTKPLGRFFQKEKKDLSGTGPKTASNFETVPFPEIDALRKGLKTVLTNRSTSLRGSPMDLPDVRIELDQRNPSEIPERVPPPIDRFHPEADPLASGQG